MKINKILTNGNSSKFQVDAKNGDFIIALSFTLRTKIWELPDYNAEMDAAKEIAEAIVSRHDPALPFRNIYIFAEHNSEASLDKMIKDIRKNGYSLA